jgi:hypothetical protein
MAQNEVDELVDGEMHLVLLKRLTELEDEIRANNKNNRDMAFLYLHLGTIHGLMGDCEQQKFAWEKGFKLDPENPILKTRMAGIC